MPARSVLEVTARPLIEAGRRKPREVEPVDKGELMSAAPISAEALFNEISNELRTKFHLNLSLQNNRQYVHGVRNIADYIAKQEASGDYTIELTREGPRTLRIGVKVDGGTEFGHTIHVDGLAYPLRKDRTMERAGGLAKTHDFSERHTLSDGTNVGIQVSKTKVGDGMKWWVRVYTEDQRGESADLALNSISSARAKQIIMRTRFMKGKLSGIPAKQRKKVLQSFTVESITPWTVVSRLLEDEGSDDLKGEMLDAVPEIVITIHSSHGEFKVDSRTGRPIERERYDMNDPDGAFIDELDRFDLREWVEHYKVFGDAKQDMDILDVGYWMKDGYYEEPAQDWREEHGPQGRWRDKPEAGMNLPGEQ